MTAVEIRALRANLGLSQRDFASELGATYAEVRLWEAGTGSPLPVQAQRMWRLARKSSKG